MAPNPVPRLAVVIPYFQRESGILRKALASALGQEQVAREDVHVYVVDDASPVPAESEVAAIAPQERDRVTVLHRRNGGAGRARNTALDHLPLGVEIVAYLDSDDSWDPLHLARVFRSIDLGFDFFFGDTVPVQNPKTLFDRTGFLPSSLPVADSALRLHRFPGNLLRALIDKEVTIGMSSAAYRFDPFRTLRFAPELRYAREDWYLWFSIGRLEPRVAVSAEKEVTQGRGVNVFAGARWGTTSFLRRIDCEARFLRWICRDFPLDVAQRRGCVEQRRALREKFVRNAIHGILRGRIGIVPFCAGFAWSEPRVLLDFLPTLRRMRAEKSQPAAAASRD